MPCADIFVSHLSSLVEGFGLTILEALACGLTVVTGMDRLKSAVFEQSEAIIFVQKDDSEAVGKAINRFATQSRRTSKYAVKLASEFSIEKSMRSLEKILLACSASPSRRGLSQLSAC